MSETVASGSGLPDVNALAAIETNFHALIRTRVAKLIDKYRITLPHLEMSILGEANAAWFPVDGMCGFKYWLERRASALVLISESWIRIVLGSGRRHEVTEHGATLVDRGFV